MKRQTHRQARSTSVTTDRTLVGPTQLGHPASVPPPRSRSRSSSAVSATHPDRLWTRWLVRWDFIDRLMGGIPADPELQRRWLESRRPKIAPPDARPLAEIAQEVFESTLKDGAVEPEVEEYKLNVFQRHDGVLVMRTDTIRSHLKDCGRILSSMHIGKIQGERSFVVRVVNGIYYPPEAYWTPILTQTNKPITEADGTMDLLVHTQTPRGQRISAIKTLEYLVRPRMEFELWVMHTHGGTDVVSEADLKLLFMYGGTHGYGPERGRGEGKYVWTLEQA